MNQTIESVFPSLQAPLVVLDCWNYVQRLFLSNKSIPWNNPSAFDAFYRQVLGLLRPQVATLDLDRIILSHADRQVDLYAAMTKRPRLSFPLKTLLAELDLSHSLKQLISATRDARGSRPLVLTLSSPLDLLRRVYEMAHGQSMPHESQDDAERAAVYLADFLSRSSHDGVAGIWITDRAAEAQQAGFAEAMSPLMNLARHMRWKFLMASQANIDSIAGVDFLWTPKSGPGLWLEDFMSGEVRSNCQAIYAEIPTQAEPEQVLSRLNALAGH